jgi:hypothetical protein
MAEGVTTSTGSSGLNFVVSMKKVNKRNATSHMGVMSTRVLLCAIFTLGILLLLVQYINKMQFLPDSTIPSTQGETESVPLRSLLFVD